MIVPSIDIKDGRAVQLRHGKEFVLDGGDPLDRLEQFAVAGEVAAREVGVHFPRSEGLKFERLLPTLCLRHGWWLVLLLD